jgi:AcrR family transcriptional regulator
MTGARLGRPRGISAENTARRRQQIVEAAIDCIVEHGFSSTTIAKVSTAAGLSQGMAVFYFKTKEILLEETLRYHYEAYQRVWQAALERAPEDPVEKIMALVFADLDPAICTPRNVALWNSFWGEAGARPRFAEICDEFDGERNEVLIRLCEAVEDLIAEPIWSASSVVAALDTMTDGVWIRMHISPNLMSKEEARELLARFLATVLPARAAQILTFTEELNRSFEPRQSKLA